MAQPHPPAAPSTGGTEGHPAGLTATSPQVAGPVPAEPPVPRGNRRPLVLIGCALLGIVIGVGGQQLTLTGSGPTATPAPSPSATIVTAPVTPVAPGDTSSFKKRDGVWKSQTYADANFGNLKNGIGLRLDLGTTRPLTSVTFTAENGPLTVELRAGDAPATDGKDYQLVGQPVQADGKTTLPATAGGSHRYWMIWVTKLPPDFVARIADSVVARG